VIDDSNEQGELADEYGRVVAEWREFCEDPATIYEQPSAQPMAVVLLTAIAEPQVGKETFTGDLLSDVLTGLMVNVRRWSVAGDPASAGVVRIRAEEVNALERRLRLAVELRRREHLVVAMKG
jgi:hypothetical protein